MCRRIYDNDVSLASRNFGALLGFLLRLDPLDVWQFPALLLEQRLLRAVEARENLEAAFGIGRNPVEPGAFGPKYKSAEPSAFHWSSGVCDERPTHFALRMNACVARS